MYGYGKKEAICPVCADRLGWISKNQTNVLLCKECQWFFKWDHEGKMLPPEKYVYKKPVKCGCVMHRD